MTTYSKPHKAMTIRSGSGKSQNIDNLKYLNTEETDPEPKNRGFFRKYLWWLGLFPSKEGKKNVKQKQTNDK